MLQTDVTRFALSATLAIVMTVGTFVPPQAAEPAATERNPDRLEEVIVTAQRRAENLQNVPVAISALTQDVLTERDIKDVADIALVAPGVSYVKVGPGESQFLIRGVQVAGMNATEPRFQPSVGIYFDEIPVATALYSPSLNTFDVARVEVLRGPQGTLYGSGSLSGTVKFITNSPSAGGVDVAARGDLSNTEHSHGTNGAADGMVNLPLVQDRVALRIVGGYRVDDGFVENLANGSKDVGRTTEKGGRVAVGFTPSDRFNVTLMAISQLLNADDHGSMDLETPGVVPGPPGRFQQWRLTPTRVADDFRLFAATANYDLKWAQFTSATSYVHRALTNDRDGTTLAALIVPPPLQFAPLENPLNYHGVTQELRLTSPAVGALRWQAGVYYSSLIKHFSQLFPVAGSDAKLATIGIPPATFFGAEPDDLFHSHLNFDERQRAVFGELSYGFLNERLVATVGGRWFDYNLTYHVDAAGVFNGGVTSGAAQPDARDFNPKFVLSYRALDNVLVALQAAQGFRLGGPNDVIPTTCATQLQFLGLTSAPLSFGPEKLRSYELNSKTSWLEDRLIANVAVYKMNYQDIQVNQPLNKPTSCGFSYTSNGGKASSKGVELELAGRIGQWFRWSVEGTWTDATLDEDLPSGSGHAGDRLPFSAPFTGSAFARFSFPAFASLNGYVQLDYRYVGERIQELGYQTSPDEAQPTSPFSIVNVQLGVERKSWEAHLFVDNAANDTSILSGGQLDFGPTRYVIRNRPRTVGLSVMYRMK